MKRRQFIELALPSLLLPVVSRASPLEAAPATGRLFFDDRFPDARRHISHVARAARVAPVAVRGDVTPFWVGSLDHLAPRQQLHLQGVTTESFRFCLEILLRERAQVSAQVSRLDRNLLLWEMHSAPARELESIDG